MDGILWDVMLTTAVVIRTLWVVGISAHVLEVIKKVPEDFLAKLHALAAEMRPFYLPALCMNFSEEMQQGIFWDPLRLFFNVNAILLWFFYKSDDRWKKRGKKALEKIKRIGARLVVVPATS